jgi:hypothetical protein
LDDQKPEIQVNEDAGDFLKGSFTDPSDQVPAIHQQVQENGQHKSHNDDQGCETRIGRLLHPEDNNGKEKTNIADKSRSVKHPEQTHGPKIQISD